MWAAYHARLIELIIDNIMIVQVGPRAFNRVCASIRINRDYDVVSVRINANGVTKRAWAFNCETTVNVFLSYIQNNYLSATSKIHYTAKKNMFP